MSQENVEIVRAAFEAINRGDIEAALEDAAPGFALDFSRAVGPVHGVFGREEMPGVFEEVDEPWESVRREAEEFIEAGEHVVTPMTSYHRGRDRRSWVRIPSAAPFLDLQRITAGMKPRVSGVEPARSGSSTGSRAG